MKKDESKILGICSWTLGIEDLDELMHTVSKLGLNGIQYCEPLDRHPAVDVRRLADEYGLKIIINDPFDCRPGEKHGEATFENAISFYKNAIQYASQLGCGQTLQGLSAWTANCDNDDDAWLFLVNAVAKLSEFAEEQRVPLAYEPCNLYEVPYIHTAADYQRLIDDAGVKNVSVLLDSFHMNIGEKNPLATLEAFADRNAIFHISNANREGIQEGHIDFSTYNDILREQEYVNPVAFEFVLSGNPVNTPPRDAIEMQNLKTMVKNSAQIWRDFN